MEPSNLLRCIRPSRLSTQSETTATHYCCWIADLLCVISYIQRENTKEPITNLHYYKSFIAAPMQEKCNPKGLCCHR